MIYILGLGSNIGSLEENLDEAVNRINQIDKCRILKKSSHYQTKPWGYIEQSDFLNMVIEIECECSPEELLISIKEIETEMGRVQTKKWRERIIDIDILLCNDIIMDTENLTIPHKYLEHRQFVLEPLCEIEPDLTHPILKLSIKDLLNKLKLEVK